MKGKRLLALFLALSMLIPLLGMAEGAEEEYILEREPGTRQLTLYWTAPDADYATCDVWLWYPGGDGRGHLLHPCAYGAKCVVNVPEGVSEVGFIVRRSCSDPGGASWGEATKDFPDDRFAILTGDETSIYLKAGDGMQYTSPDGGQTLEPIRIFQIAGIIGPNQIRYIISPAARLESLDQVHVYQGDRELEITGLSSLNNNVVMGTITLAEAIDISVPYSVEIEEYGRIAAVPTDIFDSADFIANYTYDLAKEYNQFYHDTSILKEEDARKRQFRLVLSTCVARVIKTAMDLLGIEVPERM